MWQCPKCGEEIEDTFDSCWKCAPTERPPDESIRVEPKRCRGLFFIYWERGWMVLLMNACFSGILLGTGAVILVVEDINQGLAALVALASFCSWLPVVAYGLFVLWLGKNAWRLPTATRRRSLALTYWKRGWLIMLMNFCIGIIGTVGGVGGVEVTGAGQGLGVILSLTWLFCFMPAAAYWIYVFFFGAEAWPLPKDDE